MQLLLLHIFTYFIATSGFSLTVLRPPDPHPRSRISNPFLYSEQICLPQASVYTILMFVYLRILYGTSRNATL